MIGRYLCCHVFTRSFNAHARSRTNFWRSSSSLAALISSKSSTRTGRTLAHTDGIARQKKSKRTSHIDDLETLTAVRKIFGLPHQRMGK